MSDMKIEDFSQLADLQGDDLVLISSGGEYFNTTINTLKAVFKSNSEETSSAAALAAQEAANAAKKSAESASEKAENAENAAKEANQKAKDAEGAAKDAEQTASAASNSAAAASASAAAAALSAANANETLEEILLEIAQGIVADITQTESGSLKVIYSDGNSKEFEINASGGGLAFESWAYDQDTFYLHLYGADGLDVIDPVYIPGGGGGGSTGSKLIFAMNSSAVFSVAENAEEANVTFTFTSVDETSQVATGAGTLQIYVNGEMKRSMSVPQGENTINLREHLSPGSNTVKLVLTDSYGHPATRTVVVSVETLTLEWNLGATEKATDILSVSLTPTGSNNKTVYILIDGVEYTSFSVATTGRRYTKTVAAQAHGDHIIQAYCTMVVDGITLTTPVLTCAVAWVSSGNNTPVIACDMVAEQVEQFTTLLMNHRIIDPGNNPAEVTYKVNGVEVKTVTVDQSEQIWSYKPTATGTLTFEITCGITTWSHTTTVTGSTSGVEETSDGLEVKLDATSMATLDGWNYNGYNLTLSAGFDTVNGGLQIDSDGVQGIRVMKGDRLTLNYAPFAKDARVNGNALKLVYRVTNPSDYDGIAIQCLSGNIGLDIRANEAIFKSEQATLSVITCEGRKTELDLDIRSTDDHRIMAWHSAGVLSKAAEYVSGDNFTQTNAVGITFGSDTCDVWLYLVRGYSRGLTKAEIIANYEADGSTASEINARHSANQIYDGTGNISPTLVAECCPDAHVLVFAADDFSSTKEHKVTGSLTHYFVSGGDAHKWIAPNVVAKVQGTTSAGYILAGLNQDFSCEEGFDLEDGTHIDGYSMTADSIPVNYFNFKVNTASSEHVNNILMAEWYNRFQPYVRPCRKTDPRIRDTVEGHIAVLFYKNTGSTSVQAGAITVAPGETAFYGIGCLNNSKKNYTVFGQDDEDDILVIEQCNNTSDQCRGKSDDLTGEMFDNTGNFEFRYKSDTVSFDEAKALFQELLTFIVSTNTDGATNLALPEAVTYEGTSYTTDSKEYRLAKYKAEAGNHMIMDTVLFQHLMTLTYTLPDNRAKNMFWAYSKSAKKWHLCFAYDMDTGMGNDNEGGLTLKAGYMDTDTIGTKSVFNAADSTIYQNNRLALADELTAMYKDLENKGCWDMVAFGNLADKEQNKICQALWAEDEEKKYLLPLINSGSSAYLPMANGKKDAQRWNFLTFQRPFISSYFLSSYALSDVATIRGYTPATGEWAGVAPSSKMTITPYYNLWVTVKAGSNIVRKRAGAGEPVELDLMNVAMNDTEIYPYGASMLQDLGDLACLYPGYCDLAACSRLQKVIIGSSETGYKNTNMTELSVKNCVSLEELDVQNCPNLKQAIDLTGNVYLRTLLAKGSGITGASFASFGRVEDVEFPASVASIQAKQLNYLRSMALEGFENLSTLVMENCPALDSYAFASAAVNLARVRLIGIDWTVPLSGYDLLARLHGCAGIDDDGYNTVSGVITGSVHFTQITQTKLANIRRLTPDVEYSYDQMLDEVAVVFKNEDGTILYETRVEVGGTVPNPVTAGYIDAPTKASTVELVYTFWKWDKDLSNITTETVFTAMYTSTNRYYNVTFHDKEGNVVESHRVVAHTNVMYTGADLPSDDFMWVGWLSDTTDVVSDMQVMPEYIYPTPPSVIKDLSLYDYAYSDDPDDNAAYTKAELAGILLGGLAKEYFEVGDEVKIVPHTTVFSDTAIVMQLCGFNHFKLADGSGNFAGAVFGMKGAMTVGVQMNSTNTNTGGWASCKMRTHLNKTIYPALPPFWRAIIRAVEVLSSAGNMSTEITTSSDKLFLFSQAEVGFDTGSVPYKNEVVADAESLTLPIFTDNASRIKKTFNGEGSTVYWWLRSPAASSASAFCSVSSNGYSGSGGATSSSSVAFGFCI